MSIINSYDENKKALINVEDIYEKSERPLDACIINFSHKITTALLENGSIELFDGKTIKSVAGNYPIYRFKGTNIGFMQTQIGAPLTAGLIIEVGYVFSCKKFVMFGSCGGLDKTISSQKLIVPTYAYRDEGTSYHYLPAGDYIKIKNSSVVAEILSSLNVDFVEGRVWTTDAFFRETKRNFEARKGEGCIAVDMELSACQAVADYTGIELYNFLYRADNLDASKWERGFLSLLPADQHLKPLYVALEIAKQIVK